MLFLVSAWQSFEIFWPHWRSWWGKWEMGICKTLHIMQGRTRLIFPESWPASTDWKSATENAGRCLLLVAHFWECLQLFISLDLRNVYTKLENANCLRFFIPQALERRTPASNKTEDDSTTDAKQKQTREKEAVDSKKATIKILSEMEVAMSFSLLTLFKLLKQ